MNLEGFLLCTLGKSPRQPTENMIFQIKILLEVYWDLLHVHDGFELVSQYISKQKQTSVCKYALQNLAHIRSFLQERIL